MTEENTGITEEDAPLDEAAIGEDRPQLGTKKVLVEDYELADVKKNDKVIGKKLILKVKHPDVSDRQIEISGVKYEFRDKIKISGMWLNRDNDGKIPYNSAVSHLLRFMGKKNIKELKGEQVSTATDDMNYLVVKAY